MRMRTGHGLHACVWSDLVVRCQFANFGPLACASSDSRVTPSVSTLLRSEPVSGLLVPQHSPDLPSRRPSAAQNSSVYSPVSRFEPPPPLPVSRSRPVLPPSLCCYGVRRRADHRRLLHPAATGGDQGADRREPPVALSGGRDPPPTTGRNPWPVLWFRRNIR